MAQDYAKSASNKWQHKNTLAQHKSKLIILCLVLSAFALYKYSSIDINQIQKHVAKKIAINQTRPKQLPKPKFEFYTRLPKANSSFQYETNKKSKELSAPSNHNVQVIDAKPIAHNSRNYLIQVASFKKLIDADNLRASLIMQGHIASLSQFKNNTNTWYRVEIGPFESLQQAKKEQLTLEKLKYNGLIKKIS